MSLTKYIIVDIDHTISDAAWRDPLLGKWDEYYLRGAEDDPIKFVVEDIIRLASVAGYTIAAVTGRPENWRGLTMRWMLKHNVPIDLLFMRGVDDRRPSPEVKTELVRTYFPNLEEIVFVLEDRDDCVAAYRQMGLNVLQVAFYNGRGGRHGENSQVGKDPDGEREDADWGGGSDQISGGHPSRPDGDLRAGLSADRPEPPRDVS